MKGITRNHTLEAAFDTRDRRIVWQRGNRTYVRLPDNNVRTVKDLYEARCFLAWVYAGNDPDEYTFEAYNKAIRKGFGLD